MTVPRYLSTQPGGELVYAFFISHWLLSVLFQSLFQHRYAAHKMYTMPKRTERVLHFLAFLVQGSTRSVRLGMERVLHFLAFLVQGSSYLDPHEEGEEVQH